LRYITVTMAHRQSILSILLKQLTLVKLFLSCFFLLSMSVVANDRTLCTSILSEIKNRCIVELIYKCIIYTCIYTYRYIHIYIYISYMWWYVYIIDILLSLHLLRSNNGLEKRSTEEYLHLIYSVLTEKSEEFLLTDQIKWKLNWERIIIN